MTDSPDNDRSTVSIRGRITGVEVTVTFQVEPADLKRRLAEVLEQLTEVGIEAVPENREEREEKREREEHSDEMPFDGPLARIARDLEVPAASLKNILGIKGDSVDLFRAGRLPIADALSAICFAYEKGLGKAGMSYETFQGLVEANQIKMKTPLPTVCFNLMNGGRIDRKQYNDGKVIVLTPDGERKATETLKALISGSAKQRPARSERSTTKTKAKKNG